LKTSQVKLKYNFADVAPKYVKNFQIWPEMIDGVAFHRLVEGFNGPSSMEYKKRQQ